MFQRILIAYDGSPESKKALETGIALARELKADTSLVSVIEPLPGYIALAGSVEPSYPAELIREHREKLGAMQAEVKQKAAQSGMEIDTLLVEAGEAEGVLEAVRETQAGLLVVGLRPHDHTVEFAGTLRRIANQIHCPVLAVPCH
ncbi:MULTISPECIES: universal stress protein [Acidobacterium]|uniref:Universal stress family protein n=1 Tax=Acidobacterium capsulatum (strain ATCC 51196 / DSM 11244 / BCRC 80197 / JCM 7670 / NBRC 15755 / NCIMB 13165 / 161) TaxID=240015 RepID=C1F2A6_ACIC5|nr:MULTISPECIES: universal stress protein [Acidobacterium]ACO31858.1 universal stress family protein [Acidobacterium capsulatum ATCC 51196]HCT59921.1 universal stress protein [Acidobacterium sp.]